MSLGRRGWAVIGSTAPLALSCLFGACLLDRPGIEPAEFLRRLSFWTALSASGPMANALVSALGERGPSLYLAAALAIWTPWLWIIVKTAGSQWAPILWSGMSFCWCLVGVVLTGSMVT